MRKNVVILSIAVGFGITLATIFCTSVWLENRMSVNQGYFFEPPATIDPKCLPRDGVFVTPPLIIGATGDSGTRGLADMMIYLGYFLGDFVNLSLDNLDMRPKGLRHNIKSILSHTASLNYALDELPPELVEEVYGFLCDNVRNTLAGAPSEAAYKLWGWKEPNNMYLIPFWQRMFQGSFYYLHVVRDGRDIVYGDNQRQFKHYFNFMHDSRNKGILDKYLDLGNKGRFWSDTNIGAVQAATRASAEFGCKMYVVKIESLVGPNSRTAVEGLLSFLPVPPPNNRFITDLVETFTSHAASYNVEQHRHKDGFEAAGEAAAEGLRMFDYNNDK